MKHLDVQSWKTVHLPSLEIQMKLFLSKKSFVYSKGEIIHEKIDFNTIQFIPISILNFYSKKCKKKMRQLVSNLFRVLDDMST